MATKKKIEEVKEEVVEFDEAKFLEDRAHERVEIPPLFYDKDKYSAPVCVIVNGKTTYIKRGVSGLKVERSVAEVLAQSEYQNQVAGAFMDANEGIKNQGEF